jgi:tetratricopeptide (TPR) repeat protein
MKKIAFIFILACIGSLTMAQSNDELAAKARKAYDSGQYPVSIQSYESIIRNGYESSVLYYNLGNAYFRNQDLPSAILFYEKALKLDPNNADILHNINLSNSRITDKVELVPELFYKRWWKSLLNSFSIDTLAIILIILLTLTLVSAAIYLVSDRIHMRKWAFWTSTAFLVIFFISLYASQQKNHFLKNHHEAIVFTPTLTIKSSPDAASTDLFVIHEGIKVELLDQIGDWQEIKIANGSIGWLKSSDIRMI